MVPARRPATTTACRTIQFAAPSWNYALRLSGTYQLPWGITYASSFTAQSGDYFFREVQIRDALNTQRRRSASSRRPAATSGRRSGTTASRSGSRRSAASRSKATFDLFNTLNVNTITAQTNRNGVDVPAADGDSRRARVPARREVPLLN